MNDTPELRLRARHRLCQPCTGHGSMAGEQHCYHCWEPWPCEVIMALDALLPSDVESLRLSIESVIGHAERKDAEIRALQGENDRLREQADALADALQNMYSEGRYIQQGQRLFPGSWWERAITKAKDALSTYREAGRRNGEE